MIRLSILFGSKNMQTGDPAVSTGLV